MEEKNILYDCVGDYLIKDCNKGQFRYFQEESVEQLEESDVNAISGTSKWKNSLKEKTSLKEKYVNFIKKTYEPTLISTRRPEKARNKPIVEFVLDSRKVKVMFDTWAYLNIKRSRYIRVIRRYGVQYVGKVQLSMAIGLVLTNHMFDIMADIMVKREK